MHSLLARVLLARVAYLQIFEEWPVIQLSGGCPPPIFMIRIEVNTVCSYALIIFIHPCATQTP